MLDKLKEQAKRLSIGAFSAQFQGLYLMGQIPGVHAMGFATRVGSPSQMDLARAILAGKEKVPSGPFVLRVEKSDRNTWKKRISVGRATNNDLILRHDSVSKLHAHFLVRAEQRDGSLHEELVIADVGSANGTSVNRRTVKEGDHAAVTVTPGDRILFGEVECELLDAAALHNRLTRLESHDF